MKCYTLLTTNAIYTSLNYYDDTSSLPLPLLPYLKYLDNKHLQKQKGKRENSVLQKPRITLLNYSLEYLVNFFVINLIFYSKNCQRNFGSSFENKTTDQTWKSSILPSYQQYIKVRSSNSTNFSFHFKKNISSPPVTEHSEYTAFLNYIFIILFLHTCSGKILPYYTFAAC